MNKNLPLLFIFALSVFWTLSMFLAPLTLPPGNVTGLEGRANALDFSDLWDTLPPYPRMVYYFGDINCHQKWYRSFELNGNQLPVDARMTSIFTFAPLGLLTAMFLKPEVSLSQSVLNALPGQVRKFSGIARRPELSATAIAVLSFLPVAFDGFHQLLTPYESTNLTRVLTGIPMGWMGGVLLGAMIVSTAEYNRIGRLEIDMITEPDSVHDPRGR